MNRDQALALFAPYENIIFDYGGIFIDLDFQRTAREFGKLNSTVDFNQLFAKHQQIEIFNQFETGKITRSTFLAGLRNILNIESAKDESLIQAWCAMLLDIKKERIDFLRELKRTKKIYLLSNINEIHEEFAENYLKSDSSLQDFYSLFDEIYFSHHVGLRKPDPEIFKMVCSKSSLKMETTIFFDDSIQHIESARRLGLPAYHLAQSNTFIIG